MNLNPSTTVITQLCLRGTMAYVGRRCVRVQDGQSVRAARALLSCVLESAAPLASRGTGHDWQERCLPSSLTSPVGVIIAPKYMLCAEFETVTSRRIDRFGETAATGRRLQWFASSIAVDVCCPTRAMCEQSAEGHDRFRHFSGLASLEVDFKPQLPHLFLNESVFPRESVESVYQMICRIVSRSTLLRRWYFIPTVACASFL